MEKDPTGKIENRERILAGKVALITGSSRDIGAETAKALAREGINIIGNYREKDKRAIHTQEILKSLGVKSEFVQADITIENDRKKLEETVRNSFGGKLDFLVLNASGKTTDINVTAANALIDQFLPLMPIDSTIVLMQSVPGHFEPQLDGLNVASEFYGPIAKAKYQGEQSIRSRMNEFEEKGINFIVICPPEVSDTSNMKVFTRFDPLISETNTKISNMLGLPIKVTKEHVGEKIAKLLKRKDLPMGYVELFGNTVDARNIFSVLYKDETILVDTFEKTGEESGMGRLIVTKQHTGHFKENIGIYIFPGYKMLEAAAQTLGLTALETKITKDTIPFGYEVTGPIKFLKPILPGDIIEIHAITTEMIKRGFAGDAYIYNQKGEMVADIAGIKAVFMTSELAKRKMGRK